MRILYPPGHASTLIATAIAVGSCDKVRHVGAQALNDRHRGAVAIE